MLRKPGIFTGAFDVLDPVQTRRRRAYPIMGLVFVPEYPKPIPPDFTMTDRGSAAYQLHMAAVAVRYGLITEDRFAELKIEAAQWLDTTAVQTTVDGVRLHVDPPRPVLHEFENKPRKRRTFDDTDTGNGASRNRDGLRPDRRERG